MRDILFRGKCVNNGEWAKGYLFIDQSGAHYILDTNNDGDDGIKCRFILVFHETVGQYTGLTDKNGKKIFEGDIVVYNTTKYEVSSFYGVFVLTRIDEDCIDYDDFPQYNFPCGSHKSEFDGCRNDGCVSFYELLDNEQDFEGSLSCEVIGNVFDNPDLLEGR